MMNTTLRDPMRSLIAEAAEWRLIELLLSCPPGSLSEEWKRDLQSLACEVQDEDLQQAAALAAEEAEEGLFHSIFGPAAPLRRARPAIWVRFNSDT